MEDGMTSVITTNGMNGDTAKEIIEIGAKTLLSTIPVGGALISGVWDSIKSGVVQKRLEHWQNLIEERLHSLEVTLQEIGDNENFATALFQATELAIKTSEDKKRDYLANAVLNSAVCKIEESVMTIFFNLAGKYSLWHITILYYFNNPKNFSSKFSGPYLMGSPLLYLYDVYPELKLQSDFTDKIIADLYNDGLLNTKEMHASMTSSGMVDSRTTALGKSFIRFLTRDE